MAATILIVEDEHAVARPLQYALQQEGYDVALARSGEEGLEIATRQAPDLVVLDVRLPGMDGFEVLRRLRAAGAKMPVLVLTARDDEVDKVIGLELGADDYVTKPFSPRELAARVRTVLRRSAAAVARPERLQYGKIELDGASREVTRAGEPVTLTAREFDLLWFLASNPRHVFSRSHIMDRVWGHAPALDTGTVTVHIRRLREKLEDDPAHPRHLQTVWGVGYRLDP